MLSSQISYQIIRSSRKTMSLEIKADGSVVVRAPLRLSEAKIQKFVEEKQEWILKNLEKIQKRDAQKENRSIIDTLNKGWELLGMLPKDELDRIDTKILDQYYHETTK